MSIAQYLQISAEQDGVSVSDLIGPSCERHITRARHKAMYAIRVLTQASMPQIAMMFGKCDHTSISHAIQKFNNPQKWQNKREAMRRRYRERKQGLTNGDV